MRDSSLTPCRLDKEGISGHYEWHGEWHGEWYKEHARRFAQRIKPMASVIESVTCHVMDPMNLMIEPARRLAAAVFFIPLAMPLAMPLVCPEIPSLSTDTELKCCLACKREFA